MSYGYARTYRGPIQVVVLDQAGTFIDFGCIAPAQAFVEVFRRRGVEVTVDEARGPMGTYKRDHIEQMTLMPGVRERWLAAHEREPEDDDVQAMFEAFVPIQLAMLGEHAVLIDGALATAADIRRRGARIATTTGYTGEMSSVNLAAARRQGFVPDASVCSTDVPYGRPYPAMCLQAAINLGAGTVHACVKVDDTPVGIEAGLNAGMWTVGLAVSGNGVGLSRAEWDGLSTDEQEVRRERSAAALRQAGAHYVADTIADLPWCLDDIERRLTEGEKP